MKKAFTMLELVFVIVVIGILAAVIIPRVKTNPVDEAAVNLLSKIRYTQHLALVDDKYGENTLPAVDWYKKRWQINFSGNTYSIVSDNNATFAKDPQNSDDINNTTLKGISTITANGGCTTLSFDYMGRPLVGSLSATAAPYTNGNLLRSDCNITITDTSGNQRNITITPETGYAFINY